MREHELRLLLQGPIPDGEYYLLCLLASQDGSTVEVGSFSHWVGHTDDRPPREIRAASLVKPEVARRNCLTIGEPAMTANTEEDALWWFLLGGQGLIERTVAERVFPEWLEPEPVAHAPDEVLGYVSVRSLPAEVFHRAPKRKARMQVLKRDEFRCRLCGASPRTDVQVNLHLHHVRPWELGGLTHASNLVTLCQACHDGLDPHFDPALFIQAGCLPPTPTHEERIRQYCRRVEAYRKLTWARFVPLPKEEGPAADPE